MSLSWPLNAESGLYVGAPGVGGEFLPNRVPYSGMEFGGNTVRDSSLKNGQRDNMDNQPAFFVTPPAPWGHSPPDTTMALTNVVATPGVPTFFNVGVRAANGRSFEGAPLGLRLLLLPPDKYSAVRNVRTSNDVRLGFKQPPTSKKQARVPLAGA